MPNQSNASGVPPVKRRSSSKKHKTQHKTLWPLPPWVWTVILFVVLVTLLITFSKRQNNPPPVLGGGQGVPVPTVVPAATCVASPTNNDAASPVIPPPVSVQPVPPPQVSVTPAPAPVIYNITKVNVENSPYATVSVATEGGNSQQQIYDGADWKDQPPTRREDLGIQPSDTLQPGEIVEYTIPRGGYVITPQPAEGSIPPTAIGWVPVNPCGNQMIGGKWQCGAIHMRISPWWHGGPIRVNFNYRPQGQQLGWPYNHR
jgi:hypothetical protein